MHPYKIHIHHKSLEERWTTCKWGTKIFGNTRWTFGHVPVEDYSEVYEFANAEDAFYFGLIWS